MAVKPNAAGALNAMVDSDDDNEQNKEAGYKNGYLTFISKDGKYKYKLYVIDLLTKYSILKLIESKFKSTVNRIDPI